MTSLHPWRHAVGGSQRAFGALALALLLLLPARPAVLATPLDDAPPAPHVWRGDAFPAYVGLDTIHVRYSYQSNCTTCRRELVALMPGGSVVVLANLPTGAVAGSVRHSDLPPGLYGYRIVETGADGKVV